MEDFVTTTGSEIHWRYSGREPLIDYAAATQELVAGKAIKVFAKTKEEAWRKRATLAQQFRLRGMKVKSRCAAGQDGSFEIVLALVA
jgi:hypothetical protein